MDNRTLKKIIYYAFPLHIIFNILSFIFRALNINTSLTLTSRLMINIIYELIISFILIFVLKEYLYKSWLAFKKRGISLNLKAILLGFLLACSMLYAWKIIDLVLTHNKYDLIGANQENIQNCRAVFPLATSFLSIIIAPFTEECLYRGAIFYILKKANDYIAMLGTAILFAFVHVIPSFTNSSINPISLFFIFMNYFPLGLCLSIIYKKHNNIWINIGVHMVWNIFAIFISCIR